MLYVAHCTNLHEVRDERVSAARAHMITYVSARQPYERHLHRERAQNKRVGCTTRRRANSGRKADTAEAQTMLARPDIPSGCSRVLFGLAETAKTNDRFKPSTPDAGLTSPTATGASSTSPSAVHDFACTRPHLSVVSPARSAAIDGASV